MTSSGPPIQLISLRIFPNRIPLPRNQEVRLASQVRFHNSFLVAGDALASCRSCSFDSELALEPASLALEEPGSGSIEADVSLYFLPFHKSPRRQVVGVLRRATLHYNDEAEVLWTLLHALIM